MGPRGTYCTIPPATWEDGIPGGGSVSFCMGAVFCQGFSKVAQPAHRNRYHCKGGGSEVGRWGPSSFRLA